MSACVGACLRVRVCVFVCLRFCASVFVFGCLVLEHLSSYVCMSVCA